MKGWCRNGDKCRFAHDEAKHHLDKVRDRMDRIQVGGSAPDLSARSTPPPPTTPAPAPSPASANESSPAAALAPSAAIPPADENVEVADGTNEVAMDQDREPSLELEEVSQAPLQSEPEPEPEKEKPAPQGVKLSRPKLWRGRGRGARIPDAEVDSETIRRMQEGRGFVTKKTYQKEFYAVNNRNKNNKGRSKSRERGPSPSPRKGQRKSRRSSSEWSFKSARSTVSSRDNSRGRSQERRLEARQSSHPMRERVAPPRPRSRSRPRSAGDRSVRDRNRSQQRQRQRQSNPPMTDQELGRWYRQNQIQEGGARPRVTRSAPRNMASREDLRMMSDDGLRYLEGRLRTISQSGNANGLSAPPVSGPRRFRGNTEELRDRAVGRMNSRTSNRVHSGEINDTAAGLMRERMERNLRWRR